MLEAASQVVRLRQKLSGAASAVKSLFGQGDSQADEAVTKLEALKQRLQEVKALFRDQKGTEFVIVTIPTVLAISESGRLLQGLQAEGVPVRRMVVNQLMRRPAAGAGDPAVLRSASEAADAALAALLDGAGSAGLSADGVAAARTAVGEAAAARDALLRALQADVAFCSMKRKDQERAMGLIDQDVGLKALQRIEAPLFDLEIRGVPALRFFGDQVWTA